MEQMTLGGTSGRRRTGRTAAAVELTIRAWRKAGTLDGPEHAATRSALRDAAAAVDASRDALDAARARGMESTGQADDVSRCANRHGDCARRLLEMVTAASGGEAAPDGFDAFLASLSGPQVRD